MNSLYEKAGSDAEAYQTYLKESKITFLPFNPNETFKRQKYKGAFKTIWLSKDYAQLLPQCTEVLGEEGIVHVEHARFAFELTQEQIALYEQKVVEIAAEAGLERVSLDDPFMNCYYLAFKRK